LPQLGQRIAADHRRQQQPVGLQRAADLRQHAGQIVDELKRERGDARSSDSGCKRQRFGLIRQIDARDRRSDRQRRSQLIRPASRRRHIGKIPQHRVQPLAMSSATRSSRNVAGPARARDPAARAARRGRTGWARRFGFEAMPVGTPILPFLAIRRS
jgi:hypothetical protein